MGCRYLLGVAYFKSHIYDISANNQCFLRANLLFYVSCSRKTKHPPLKHRKFYFYDPPPTTRKKSGIFGHKLAVGSRDSTPKSAVFSVRMGSNGLSTCFLCDVVSSCQFWFGSVHFCRRYGGKTLPEEAWVISIA